MLPFGFPQKLAEKGISVQADRDHEGVCSWYPLCGRAAEVVGATEEAEGMGGSLGLKQPQQRSQLTGKALKLGSCPHLGLEGLASVVLWVGHRIGVTSGRGDDLGLGSFLLPRHSQRVDSPESSSSSTPYVGGINSSCRKGNLGGRITEFSKFSKQLSLSSAPV